MLPELRITWSDWERLRGHLDSSFRSERREERGAIALLGEVRTNRRCVYLVTEVLLPSANDVVATADGLVFRSQYIRRAHLKVRAEGLAGIATFHTHPLSDTRVGFSTDMDDVQDPQLIENLVELHPATRLVSVVLGRRAQAARVWTAPDAVEPLSTLTIVGDRIDIRTLDGAPPGTAPEVSEIFDRASALTGGGALSRLSRMTVAIIGVSGIGSIMRELAVRAGVGRVLLVDDDRMGRENVHRVLGSSMDDATAHRLKTIVAEVATLQTGLGTQVERIDGNVLDRDVLRRLRDADVIIGCVDRDWPRQLLCQFSMRYLVPYVDLGSEIGTDRSGTSVVSLDSRVSYFAPGRWCLRCSGFVTPRRLRFESLTRQERGREIALGYSHDLLLRQPAVMELNMRAAALGSMLLRHLVQPFLLTPLPVAFLEDLVMYSTRRIERPRTPSQECSTCRANGSTGYGDCAPALGYSADTLAGILDDRAAPAAA